MAQGQEQGVQVKVGRSDLASLAHTVIFAGDEVAHSLVAVLQGTLDVSALPAPLGPHVLPPPLYVC